jgi:pseudaminic acid biosynthesis-associated methylase
MKRKNKMNPQEKFWAYAGGDAYVVRNNLHPERYTERKLFFNLFESLKEKNLSILEVGCNCGINLSILKDLGFTNLSGIDVNLTALKDARCKMPEATFTKGSALELPYKDGEFDLIFTSGVLIHMAPPDNLHQVLNEIYRCSSKYILGLEDYADDFRPRHYRMRSDLYWKGPYKKEWQQLFPEMVLEEENKIDSRICYRFNKS